MVLEDWNYPYYLHREPQGTGALKVLEDWNYPYYLHLMGQDTAGFIVLEDWNYSYYLHGCRTARRISEFLRIGIIRIICTNIMNIGGVKGS